MYDLLPVSFSLGHEALCIDTDVLLTYVVVICREEFVKVEAEFVVVVVVVIPGM